ncbi:peptidylprolyl isomerase [Arcobacter sp. FWKO B]|uniref:peptidylprolyl isomerase n=1 Tax=Arcobacter sp. FWKO B TaxID=2593672 RepID=UPI0018A61317|nr:peptidylprolyl isomerase [Arcobacter sp. FWKO B]QOG12650.1 peptidylprolyl isomerase [Arcobacter sp. FWKO B]
MKTKFLSSLCVLALSYNIATANVFATVDGESINADDIAMVIRNPQVDFSSLPKETQTAVINQAVEKKLLSKEAIKSGIKSNPQYIEAMKKIEQDLALEIWMQEKFSKITVSEAEILTFHKNNPDQFVVPTELKASHILVKTKDEASQIIKELNSAKDKKAKFAELAKSKSLDPNGQDGGDLGWFFANQMVPEFSKAASSLKAGEISKEPVQTQFGFHVIYLENLKPSKTLTLNEVKEDVKQLLVEEKFRNEIKQLADNLRKKAKIEIK